MSELKAYIALISELNPAPCQTVYLKSEADAVLAEKDKEIARQNEAWNRLCKKYNKFVSLKQEFCEKFKDIVLEIDK